MSDETAETAPGCACGCGEPVGRTKTGSWRKFATDACRRRQGAFKTNQVLAKKRELSTAELVERLKHKLSETIEHLTTEKMEQANLQDTAVTIGVLTDKINVLEGRPTEILRFEHRHKLEVVGTALIQELQKRGKIVDATAEKVRIFEPEPVEPPH